MDKKKFKNILLNIGAALILIGFVTIPLLFEHSIEGFLSLFVIIFILYINMDR